MSLRNLSDLRQVKARSDEKLALHEKRIRAMYDVKIMQLLVPSIIRDENHRIDFTKALAHLSIAALPLIYNQLKQKSDWDFTKIMELIQPFLDGFNAHVSAESAEETK